MNPPDTNVPPPPGFHVYRLTYVSDLNFRIYQTAICLHPTRSNGEFWKNGIVYMIALNRPGCDIDILTLDTAPQYLRDWIESRTFQVDCLMISNVERVYVPNVSIEGFIHLLRNVWPLFDEPALKKMLLETPNYTNPWLNGPTSHAFGTWGDEIMTLLKHFHNMPDLRWKSRLDVLMMPIRREVPLAITTADANQMIAKRYRRVRTEAGGLVGSNIT